MDDRMVLPPLDHAVGAERAAPVGAEFEPPPMAGIAKVDGAGRLVKDQRAGAIHAGQHAGIVAGIGRRFRGRHITGRIDEALEVPVGDRRGRDPEGVDPPPARTEERRAGEEWGRTVRTRWRACNSKKNYKSIKIDS